MRSYRTVQGDTWDMISLKVYEDEHYTDVLMNANPSHIETVIFSANVELKVPEITTTFSSDLPPWKKGEA